MYDSSSILSLTRADLGVIILALRVFQRDSTSVKDLSTAQSLYVKLMDALFDAQESFRSPAHVRVQADRISSATTSADENGVTIPSVAPRSLSELRDATDCLSTDASSGPRCKGVVEEEVLPIVSDEGSLATTSPVLLPESPAVDRTEKHPSICPIGVPADSLTTEELRCFNTITPHYSIGAWMKTLPHPVRLVANVLRVHAFVSMSQGNSVELFLRSSYVDSGFNMLRLPSQFYYDAEGKYTLDGLYPPSAVLLLAFSWLTYRAVDILMDNNPVSPPYLMLKRCPVGDSAIKH